MPLEGPAWNELISTIKGSVTNRKDGPSGECWTSSQVPSGEGNRYIQFKKAGVAYYGHRAMACSKLNPPKYYNKEELPLEASHICGYSHCINPKHLHLESAEVNRTRDCCTMYKHLPWYLCPHDPVCIDADPLTAEYYV